MSIVATRLRKGSANSARGAARLVADSLKTTKVCGVSGTVILRADIAYYSAVVVAAARPGGARFSHGARHTGNNSPCSLQVTWAGVGVADPPDDQPRRDLEADHRRLAIVEKVIADLRSGPLAHLPSGAFMANSGWLVLAAMAFNLTKAVGVAAGGGHGKAVTATIRAQLISIAGRITRTARRSRLRLPTNWPWTNAVSQIGHRQHRAAHHQLTSRPTRHKA